VISERVIRQISVVILRACDFFKIAKNQRCKQYSYGDKMVEKSKKSQTLSAAKDLCITASATTAATASIESNSQFRDVLGFLIARAMTHSTNPGHN